MHTLLLLLLALSIVMPAISQGVGTVVASSPTVSGTTTFYLHDDGAGHGHPGKRYDWANTSAPYNPLNPNFISLLYQGIELNSSGLGQSFRWIAWPAAGSTLTLQGEVNVSLYMTPSNTSAGAGVSFLVQLQNGTSASIPFGSVIAQASTGTKQLVPNEEVTVSLQISGTAIIPAGNVLILNVSRSDANANTSVYVAFDYNSTPSSFSVDLSPRIGSVSATISPAGLITDKTPFSTFANVTDSLGSQDIAGASILFVNSTGSPFAGAASMILYSQSQFADGFIYTTTLPYGAYTINITVKTLSNLSGSSQVKYATLPLHVAPSLSNFTLMLPGNVQAGTPFLMSNAAYGDNGSIMDNFNGSANIALIYPNGTALPSSLISRTEANFSRGLSSFYETVNRSGIFTALVSNGSASGSAPLDVSPGSVSVIDVSPLTVALSAGETEQFTAAGYDVNGNLNTSWTPEWGSSSGAGTISASGFFTALKNGTCQVNALDAATGASGAANVSISHSSLFSMVIDPPGSNLLAGQTYFFSVYGYDFYGNAVPLQGVVWKTNAGTLYENGTVAMLNATKSTMSGGWVEAYSGGITALSVFNVTASAFSPQVVAPVPGQTWPSGSGRTVNLSSFFSDPNDPSDTQLVWYLTGGGGLLYAYGSGMTGNMQLTMIPYSGAYGEANVTILVSNTLGYSVSETFTVNILPSPRWVSDFPLYMTVPSNTYYTLNYTYFLEFSPFPPSFMRLTTDSQYVYSSGTELTYFFPASEIGKEMPVIITATNPDNISSSIVQLVSVSSSPAPTLNTASAPPSALTINRGSNTTLAYPVDTYFLSQRPLTFGIYASGVSAYLATGNVLYIVAPSASTNAAGSVLISARTDAGEYSFLQIKLDIVNAVAPPSVKNIPDIYVRYSSTGLPNYSLPLLPYVTDSYVPLSQVVVITGSVYVTFESGNFSLLFAMPENSSGTGGYTVPYWYNITLTLIGGPLQNIDRDSASVHLHVHVSSTPPPGPTAGTKLPAFVMIAEDSTYTSLNLSSYITAPGGETVAYTSVGVTNFTVTVSPSGQVTIKPAAYYSGSADILFVANSSSGFFSFSILAIVYSVYVPPAINIPSALTLGVSPSVVNLSRYIINPNNEPISIEAFGKGVQIVGQQLLVVMPSGVSSETITLVFITPSGSSLVRQLTVSLVSHFPSIYVLLFYSLLAGMIAFAVVLSYQHLLPKPFQLNSVLLIHNDGRLIAHSHSREYAGMDRDILVGMFTAIQDFISTSFSELGGERQTLNRIELGRFSLHVERGTNAFILAIYSGQPPRSWPLQVRAVLTRVEGEHNLAEWDGRPESLEGVAETLSDLFPGRS